MKEVTLEICVDTPEGLNLATSKGATRIELCSSLSLGGLTPSVGFMKIAKECSVPVRAMIRPRMGDFVYNADDLKVMMYDIDAVRSAGLSGVVIGANNSDNTLDTQILETLVRHSEGLDITLHRAIDLTPDILSATRLAVELGVDAVLTSGGAYTAEEGVDTIARMQQAFGAKLEIMAGSGISPQNAAYLLSVTGISALHASGSSILDMPDSKARMMGYVPTQVKCVDGEIVEQLSDIVNQNIPLCVNQF